MLADDYSRQDTVPCPRCYEACGWCSDYRMMHGRLKLPGGGGRKCTVPGYEPEGKDCPVCGGATRVIRTTTYRPERTDHD